MYNLTNIFRFLRDDIDDAFDIAMPGRDLGKTLIEYPQSYSGTITKESFNKFINSIWKGTPQRPHSVYVDFIARFNFVTRIANLTGRDRAGAIAYIKEHGVPMIENGQHVGYWIHSVQLRWAFREDCTFVN